MVTPACRHMAFAVVPDAFTLQSKLPEGQLLGEGQLSTPIRSSACALECLLLTVHPYNLSCTTTLPSAEEHRAANK